MEGEGNIEQAMELFKKAIDLGPVNEVARDYMGIALFNMKRNEEAARYFKEALSINPMYKDAQVHLDMATQAAQPTTPTP
jgi:tetratricopeptide (TPR) repeat protein